MLLPLLMRILRSTPQRGGGSESEEGALAVLMTSEGALCWTIPIVGKESSLSVFHEEEGVLFLSVPLEVMFSSRFNSSQQTLQRLIVLCFLSPPSLFFLS